MGEMSHGMKKTTRATDAPLACLLTTRLAMNSESTKFSGTTSTAYSSVRNSAS